MAGAYVQRAANSSNAAFCNISPTAGNALVFISSTSSGGGTPTVTSVQAMSATGGTGSVLATFTIPSATATTQLTTGSWLTGAYLLSLPSGTLSVLATYNGGTPGTTGINVIEISGVSALQAAHMASSVTPGTGTDAITSGTAVASTIPAYILGPISNGGDTDTVAGTGFTIRGTVGAFFAVEDRRETVSTGSYAATFTAATHGAADTYYPFVFIFSEPPTTVQLVGQSTPTTGGSSNTSGQACWITAGFVATANGLVTSLNAQVTALGTATGLRLALYDQNGNILVQTVATIVLGLNSQATASFPYVAAGLTYYLGWQADAAITIADDGATFKGHSTANTYASGLPSSIPIGGGTLLGVGTTTIWAVGTPASSPLTSPLYHRKNRLYFIN